MDNSSAENGNTGHGHVFPRPDGIRARCGGPGLCNECSRDQTRKNAAEHSSVSLTPEKICMDCALPILDGESWASAIGNASNVCHMDEDTCITRLRSENAELQKECAEVTAELNRRIREGAAEFKRAAPEPRAVRCDECSKQLELRCPVHGYKAYLADNSSETSDRQPITLCTCKVYARHPRECPKCNASNTGDQQ